jgi:5-formyltetrahydrofolate cyclo-ligase
MPRFSALSQASGILSSPAFAGDDSEEGGDSEAAPDTSRLRPMPDHHDPHAKATLRAAALGRRDALSETKRAAAARAIARRGLPVELVAGAVVAGYSPIRSELDPTPLMQALAAKGARLALPVITQRGQSLRFRIWHEGDRLLPGSLGILEPSPAAAEVVPDIVLVPLAAFDRTGHRIGYGAGHYDRTLANLHKSKGFAAIGLAFSGQEVATVPALQHDVPLDYVLTEKKAFDFRSP